MARCIANTMKYILVTGGVISGVGKGVIASSLGAILKDCGIKVTSIKIDPYINIDAGTFSPFEHGEVYVLEDGGEVDLDLGNYERFLDITLHRDNNVTTGKIYNHVIERERRGDYLGKTVQVVPHITDAIQEWVEKVSLQPVDKALLPEVCIIELGGTIGDIEGMPFVEAFRQFQFRVKQQNICVVHVSLVPQPSSTGEHKTKPTQASVRELRGFGLSPDFIFCRSEMPIDLSVKQKISNFCHVPPEKVICLHDVKSIYKVPLMMEEQRVSYLLCERLGLNLGSSRPKNYMKDFKCLVAKQQNMRESVSIALVGKYTQLEDAYTSVVKALEHAALKCKRSLDLKLIDSEDLQESPSLDESENSSREPFDGRSRSIKYHEAWANICKSSGIIVPGGFGNRGIEGKIAVCKYARLKKIPFLGICLGLQAAVIEFSRHKLDWPNAHSQEMDPNGTKHVVIEMPEHNPGNLGGTMRLGKKQTTFTKENSKIRQLYGNPQTIEERHRHRYEVNPEIISYLEDNGMIFVGQDDEGKRMEIMELEDHPYFVACQYHPEYLSRPLKPSPPYLGLLLAATKQLDKYLMEGESNLNIDDGNCSE